MGMVFIAWSMMELVFVGVGFFTKSLGWRYLYWIIGGCILFSCLLFFWMTESPLFLIR